MIRSNMTCIVVSFLMALTSFWNQKCEAQAKPNSIWSADWSADGNYIAIAGDDSFLRIHGGIDYQHLRSYQLGVEVKCLSWSPAKNVLAIATTKGLHFLDASTGKLYAIPSIQVGSRAIDWNKSGEYLALADENGEVKILDSGGHLIRSFVKHNRNSYVTVDWHPKEDIILTGSDEMIIFDVTGKQLSFIRHRPEQTLLLSAQWHPSGNFFVSGDYGHEEEGVPTLLQFWKPDGTLIKQIKGHHSEIRNLRWTKDGQKLATGSDSLRIWSKDGILLDAAKSADVVWGLSWNPSGTHLITATYSGDVHICDNKGQIVKNLY